MKEYKIPECNFETMEKKLKRIERKCAKYGNEFHYEVKGTEMIDIAKGNENSENYVPYMYKFYIVEVEGKAHIDNWEFVAVLEMHKKGNVIRRYNQEIEIPDFYRTSENYCEHCNSKRNRNALYLIHNKKTGEFKQVGKQCLQSYTKGLNAEFVASFMQYMDTFEDMETIDYGFISTNCKPYLSTREILQVAKVLTEKLGYMKWYDYCDTCTKWQVSTYFIEHRSMEKLVKNLANMRGNRIVLNATNDDVDKANVDNIIEYYKNANDDSEFMHNVKVLLDEEYVEYNSIGLLACLPHCYNVEMDKAERKAKEEKERNETKNSEYFGEVGKRYKGIAMEIKMVYSFETLYGISHIYRLIDGNGNVFTWSTNKWLDDGAYNVDFTIKEHKEYKQEKQTVVTRCKVIGA